MQYIKNYLYPHTTVPLDEILASLDDFDVLLFRGTDYWFSYVVEWFTWSDFSHVGLLLQGAPKLNPELTGPLMLEAGYETWPDAVEHKIKWGVQITDIKRVIEAYPGHVYYRRLLIDPEQTFYDLGALPISSDNFCRRISEELLDRRISDPGSRELLKDKLAAIYDEIDEMPYDYSVVDLLRAEFGIDIGDCQRTDAFFCSALVAYVYVKLGLLSPDLHWDLIRPKDFSDNVVSDKLLNVAFGPLVKIK